MGINLGSLKWWNYKKQNCSLLCFYYPCKKLLFAKFEIIWSLRVKISILSVANRQILSWRWIVSVRFVILDLHWLWYFEFICRDYFEDFLTDQIALAVLVRCRSASEYSWVSSRILRGGWRICHRDLRLGSISSFLVLCFRTHFWMSWLVDWIT